MESPSEPQIEGVTEAMSKLGASKLSMAASEFVPKSAASHSMQATHSTEKGGAGLNEGLYQQPYMQQQYMQQQYMQQQYMQQPYNPQPNAHQPYAPYHGYHMMNQYQQTQQPPCMQQPLQQPLEKPAWYAHVTPYLDHHAACPPHRRRCLTACPLATIFEIVARTTHVRFKYVILISHA